MSRFHVTAALSLAACLAATAAGQEFNQAAVDAFVRGEMTRQQVPGVSVAVVKAGQVLLAKGYGLANIEHQVPVTPATIFQSGSVGKQFTAALVLLLVEEGKIRLDDSIRTYLPNAPAVWAPITIRHLLTHSSGIPDYTAGTVDYRRDYTEDELAMLAYGLTLEFPAGARYNYSNTGYVLLGIVIHKASGSFYGDLLRERIFEPAGMTTARVISEADIVPNRAAGYRLVDGTVKNQAWVAPRLNTTADGSLYLSLSDFIAWDQVLRTRSLLAPQSWAQIFEPMKLSSGNPYPYGFGWQVDTIAGQTRVRHGGSWQGFKAHIVRYTGDDVTVLVLANLAQADPERFADGVAAIVNPAFVEPDLTPVPDREPAVTARLTVLLEAAREGRLAPDDFAYVRAGFFPSAAKAYQERLSALGAPARFVLMERRVLGDDRVYAYDVEYEKATLRVRLGLAPDGQISLFTLRPR